jgi:hypothetical protein
MSIDIYSRDDIRNVILATSAANARSTGETGGGETTDAGSERLAAYRSGYEAALMSLATAFQIPIVANGRLRRPGVVVPVARLAVSYRAEMALARLLTAREEW